MADNRGDKGTVGIGLKRPSSDMEEDPSFYKHKKCEVEKARSKTLNANVDRQAKDSQVVGGHDQKNESIVDEGENQGTQGMVEEIMAFITEDLPAELRYENKQQWKACQGLVKVAADHMIQELEDTLEILKLSLKETLALAKPEDEDLLSTLKNSRLLSKLRLAQHNSALQAGSDQLDEPKPDSRLDLNKESHLDHDSRPINKHYEPSLDTGKGQSKHHTEPESEPESEPDSESDDIPFDGAGANISDKQRGPDSSSEAKCSETNLVVSKGQNKRRADPVPRYKVHGASLQPGCPPEDGAVMQVDFRPDGWHKYWVRGEGLVSMKESVEFWERVLANDVKLREARAREDRPSIWTSDSARSSDSGCDIAE